MIFADDPVGTVRQSDLTGAYLIREADGWLFLSSVRPPPIPTFGYRYTDIGGWDGAPQWQLIAVSNVEGNSSHLEDE